jgi:hypothetical protein
LEPATPCGPDERFARGFLAGGGDTMAGPDAEESVSTRLRVGWTCVMVASSAPRLNAMRAA